MRLPHRVVLLYFLAGQALWFVSVIAAARNQPWLTLAATIIFIAVHLMRVPRPWAELRFIATVALLGGLWETVLMKLGPVDYPSRTVAFSLIPYWLVAMWAGFAAQVHRCYSWLQDRPLLASVVGALAGPLSFRAAISLGAVHFPNPVRGLLLIGVAWAALLPAIMWLSRRWDGTTGGAEATRS